MFLSIIWINPWSVFSFIPPDRVGPHSFFFSFYHYHCCYFLSRLCWCSLHGNEQFYKRLLSQNISLKQIPVIYSYLNNFLLFLILRISKCFISFHTKVLIRPYNNRISQSSYVCDFIVPVHNCIFPLKVAFSYESGNIFILFK